MAESSDTSPQTPALKTALPDQPFKKRVAQLNYYYDVCTFSYKLRKSVKEKKDSEHKNKHKYAVVIRRQTDAQGQYRGSIIDIKSTLLCNVLLEINKGVEDHGLNRSELTVTEELMYYLYPRLLECLTVEQKKEEMDEQLICDIQAGIFYVDEYLAKTMKDVKQMDSQREISFDVAWVLFFPNSLVHSHHTETDQDTVLIVRRSGYETEQMTRRRYFKVVCNIIHNNGEGFGFAKRVLEIDEYCGTQSIMNLPIYPLKYHNNYDGVYSRAIELGKRLVQMPTHSFRESSGQASSFKNKPIFVNGHVMISPFACARFHLPIRPTVHQPLNKDSLTDDQYAMCLPIGRGYAIDCKIWGEFALTRTRNVNWNDAAFDALVLGPKQKKLIHSLVLQHAKKESSFDDIIKGKGRGLIVLLSGTLGCGKTLTAEAVAEVTHKPLYVLSVGELGITPTGLERKLEDVLELAHMWDAVLLLNEAKVFLTQRNISDLARNALVSIFLRRLEYYQGILILTTNMPKDFDHAFESRIHFSINYPDLDFNSRKIIWAMFFKRSSTNISDEELCHLASYPINGCQIKNAFSSALTINQADNSPPGSLLEDLDIVLSVLNEWSQAMHHGPAVTLEEDILSL